MTDKPPYRAFNRPPAHPCRCVGVELLKIGGAYPSNIVQCLSCRAIFGKLV